MRDYRKFRVWELSHSMALEAYRATAAFPQEEKYGLQSQIRRSATSVPTNIAEGAGRDSRADLRRFLRIAAGSASELSYLLMLAAELDLLDRSSQIRERCLDVMKMLRSLIRSIDGVQGERREANGEGRIASS